MAHFVGLEVAEEMPLRAVNGIHLLKRLLNAVLTKGLQAGCDGLTANLGTKALGHGDDLDLAGVTARALDTLADRPEILFDRHRKATIAPNRLPSGWRRCDGNR